jgi:isochorismate pyruvate lyase
MSIAVKTKSVTDPLSCNVMAEVRAGVDAVDQELVALLATRFAYMDAAARIKGDRDTVRDEQRKAQVIANVRQAAIFHRLPQELIAELWDGLVEGSIAYELERWDSLRS